MWAENSVFYQIYPLGLTGAPRDNDGVTVNRLQKITPWLDHIVKLGANAIYFSPIFESDTHGYDTRDYRKIDCRLGENADFRALVDACHAKGIRVIIDGVFNHVGRNFWAFRDVREKRWESPYKDWFLINFDGNSAYNDGFWYEGWEGHYELVKLNLRNPAVRDYLVDAVRFWIDEFDIDGLRLDVAYSLELDFIRQLRWFADNCGRDFFLLGETLHGDYNRWVGEGLLHSCTNYECYKGLWSALNSYNLFEIVHSLKRQFGPEQWTLYKGKHLYCFADNHDVSRAASILTNKEHLPLQYGILFGMPGIPQVYYGSEWGIEGDKRSGDWGLRPELTAPQWNGLTDKIARMARAHRESKALSWGDFQDLVLTNKQTVFRRTCDGETVLVAVNIDAAPYYAHFNYGERAANLLTGEEKSIAGGIELPPYSVMYLKVL